MLFRITLREDVGCSRSLLQCKTAALIPSPEEGDMAYDGETVPYSKTYSPIQSLLQQFLGFMQSTLEIIRVL
jgi:ABC-type iron transport system FetAB ATPase subunit